ncbi:MAG: aldolase/citrate lyase family protein, partial [Pseudomonadota bacterium]|nr:aldolase/citrate lyase family protein [Pseudomonadota bacterium]
MTLLKKHQFGPRDLSNSTQAASLDAAPIDAPLPSPASAPVAPIRSLFFAKQGAATDRIAGARADAVVLDLEDSVKPADRPAARGWINDLLRDGLGEGQRVFVRVNALDAATDLDADLQAVMHAGIEGLVLPMLNSAADVHAFDRRVAAAERAAGLAVGKVRFVCLLETPAAILAAAEIAEASVRTIALSFGHADFLRATHGAGTADTLLTARSTVVMAARAARLQAIASPFMDLANDRAFARACAEMKALGFSGTYTLHPRQNPIAAKAFAPSPADQRRARLIVELVGPGGGATLDG